MASVLGHQISLLFAIALSSPSMGQFPSTRVRAAYISGTTWWLVAERVHRSPDEDYLKTTLRCYSVTGKPLGAVPVSQAGFGASLIQSKPARPDGARLLLIRIEQSDVSEYFLMLASAKGARPLWSDISRGTYRLLKRPQSAWALEETVDAQDAGRRDNVRAGEHGFRKAGTDLKRIVHVHNP